MATFADFIYECENYEHSAEYSEILKESSELALMERYLDNQEFMACHPISESVSEGYFAESVDDDKIQQIMEAAEAKKKNIWNKVKNGFTKAWKAVINFFKKVFKIYDKMTSDSKVIAKAILEKEKISLDNASIHRIFNSEGISNIEFINDAKYVSCGNYKFYPTVSSDKSVSIPKIMNKIEIDGSVSNKDEVMKNIQLLLSIGILNNPIRVECTSTDDRTIELSSIYTILGLLSPDARKIAAAKKMFNKAIEIRNKKGIKIVYSDTLVKNVEELEEFINKLNEINDSENNGDLTDLSEMAALQNDIIKCASDTIKLYNAFKILKQNTLAACKMIVG